MVSSYNVGGGRGNAILRDEGRSISQGVAMISQLAKQHDYNRPGFAIFQAYQCYKIITGWYSVQ